MRKPTIDEYSADSSLKSDENRFSSATEQHGNLSCDVSSHTHTHTSATMGK